MLHQYNPKSIWYLDKTRVHGNSVCDRLTSLYFRKRSEVDTREGGVIYRRRVFRWFGLTAPAYIDYYFHSVDAIEDDADQCYWIRGRITAVYVLADRETVHHVKTVNHVSLPKSFSDMAAIRKALDALHDTGRL
jgi:hypothetical protein